MFFDLTLLFTQAWREKMPSGERTHLRGRENPQAENVRCSYSARQCAVPSPEIVVGSTQNDDPDGGTFGRQRGKFYIIFSIGRSDHYRLRTSKLKKHTSNAARRGCPDAR